MSAGARSRCGMTGPSSSEPNFVLAEQDGAVGIVTMNRPAALNALSNDALAQVIDALGAFDADDDVRAMIVTGGPQVFAAGADLKQLVEADARGGFVRTRGSWWDRVR